MTHSPLREYYPQWNFQTYDAPQIREILRKFNKVVSIHGHVHQVVYNEVSNINSCGLLSTYWPWPYPPVELPYPLIKQRRADPGGRIRSGFPQHSAQRGFRRHDAVA